MIEGGIDIYKIVDPLDLLPPEPPITPTFANFITLNLFRKKAEDNDLSMVRPDNNNGIGRKSMCFPIPWEAGINFYFRGFSFKIYNRGVITIQIQGADVLPGAFYDFGTIDFIPSTVQLQGNDGFDVSSFSYKSCNYLFEFSQYNEGTGNATDFVNETTTIPTIDFNSVLCRAAETGANHYMINYYSNRVNVIHIKSNGSCGNSLTNGIAKMNGVILGAERNLGTIPSGIKYSIFSENEVVTTTCDGTSFSIDFPLSTKVINLPYQKI